MNAILEAAIAENELLARIKSAYLDCGELHLFDADGNDIFDWPKSWPNQIANVRVFLAARGIRLAN